MTNPLRREPGFYRWMCVLAAPMVLQNLITTSLGFVDTFMVGLLGNAEMAAVNAAKGALYIIIEPLLVATLMYFCLTFPTSKLIAYFERRMRRGDVR